MACGGCLHHSTGVVGLRFLVSPHYDLRTSTTYRKFFEEFGRKSIRVLVPGAHVFVASNPLVSYIVAGALDASGLENRGVITRLVMTMRGGDRPKNAHDEFSSVSVMPRSMAEPWLLFRKPLEGRVQDNLRKWKTGGLRRISQHRPFGDVIKSHPTRVGREKVSPASFPQAAVVSARPRPCFTAIERRCGFGSVRRFGINAGRSQPCWLPEHRSRVISPLCELGHTGAAASRKTQVSR